ncbi:extracellular solute-binding protein [Candidatus Nanopelagicales bacterium]|nr:extracellular solute-binding protein [Candidatus Nanopelagicales bacterium]
MPLPKTRRFWNPRRATAGVAALAAGVLVLSACSSSEDGAASSDPNAVTVYSGRTENLIGPLLAEFTEQTQIPVDVRYGDSADLALLINEEGDRSPADVFISQSPGAIGFLAGENRLGQIPQEALKRVEPAFRNKDGQWVGLSGRVRVLVYNKDEVKESDLPPSVFDLTGADYQGQVALAPTNGSFQDFVTAMRADSGEEATQNWLDGMAANDAVSYANNTAIVEAVGRGEIPMGLVNHYYNARAQAENPDVASENYFFPNKDIGSLLIATAMGILDSANQTQEAQELVTFLLSDSAQEFFSTETSEYPLAKGVPSPPGVPPLDSLEYDTVDLDSLGGGLAKTLEMIEASGLASS